MIRYKIINWDDYFENAKSRTISKCSWCPVPNKQGRGLLRLLAMDHEGGNARGAALYGAWMQILLMCSRQRAPREGYLTDTGRADGIPLRPIDISVITRIPLSVILEALLVLSNDDIGWILSEEIDGEEKEARIPNEELGIPGIPEIKLSIPKPQNKRNKRILKSPLEQGKNIVDNANALSSEEGMPTRAEVKEWWDELSTGLGVPKVRDITDERWRKFKVRFNEGLWNSIRDIEREIAQSNFVKSEGWFGLDWLLKNSTNWRKLIEGNYRDKSVTRKQKGRSDEGRTGERV